MKKYIRYFSGSIIPKIIMGIGIANIAFGGFQFVLGNYYGGMVFLAIGGFMMFLKLELQASDKHIDQEVQKIHDAYLEKHIKGKIIDKKELNPKDFSVFTGYIRDSGDVRFKVGHDGKVRTSKCYVTAICVTKQECIVFTSSYNLLASEESEVQTIYSKHTDSIQFTKEAVEFPKGNDKCTLSVAKGEVTDKLEFYLPSEDFLVDQLFEKISQM